MDGHFFIASESGGKWFMEVTKVSGIEGKKTYVLAFAQDAAGEVYALTSITRGPKGDLDTTHKIVPAD